MTALGLTWRSSARFFRRHPAQLLLAVLGLAVGVAAVISVESARTTISRSFADFTQLVEGRASHRIEARDGFVRDAQYLSLRRQFGGIAMAPVLEGLVLDADGNSWQLLGVDIVAERAFRNFTGKLIDDPGFPLPAWLAGEALVVTPEAGTSPTVELANGTSLAITARLPERQLASASRLLVADLGLAQQLAGDAVPADALSYVDVIADDAQQASLRKALPATLTLRAVSRQQTAALSQAFELNLLALSLLALLVGAFIVFNTMRFFVLQRQQLFALKRLLGMTPAQIALVVALEALLVGALGTAVGCFAGMGLAQAVMQQMAGTVSDLYYQVPVAQVSIAPLIWVKALALGFGGALAAALWPAIEAARSQPFASSQPAVRVARGMLVTGLLAALLALVLQWIPALLAALAAVFFAALAYVLICIPVTGAVLGRLRLPLHRSLVRGFALSRLPFTLNRTAAAVAALLLAVATVVGVDHMIYSFRGTVVDWLNQSLTADAYFAVRDDNSRLPEPLLEALDEDQDIAQLARFVTRELRRDDGRLTLSGQQLTAAGRSAFQFLHAWPGDGWAQWQTSDAALVSEPLARRLGLQPGDQLTLPTPTGEAVLTVLGVFVDFRSDGGRAIASLQTVNRHWGDSGLTSVGLFFKPGRGAETLRWLGLEVAARPQLRLARTREIRRQSLLVFDRTFALTRGLKWLAAIVAFVGVLGAVMALQLERRNESRLLATLGMTAGDRARLLAMEALGLGLVAGLLALPLGALLAWMLTDLINLRAFGWSLDVRWRPATFGFGLGLAVSAAALGSLWPLWTVSRGRDAQLAEPC